MELDEANLNPWIHQIEVAFKPYADFVVQISEQLKEVSTVRAKATLAERRVLLVDDAEINRVLMSHYFKGLPVRLDFAISVSEAILKCKEQAFDLIVVDDELQSLKDSELVRVPVKRVALSNHDGKMALELGFPHQMRRGLPRDEAVAQLKALLWDS